MYIFVFLALLPPLHALSLYTNCVYLYIKKKNIYVYTLYIYTQTHTPNISVAMLLFWFIVFIVGIFVIAIDVMWLCVVYVNVSCVFCSLDPVWNRMQESKWSPVKYHAKRDIVNLEIMQNVLWMKREKTEKMTKNERQRERDRKKRKVSMESIWAFRITAICTWLYRSNTNNQIGDNFWDIYLSSLKRRWTKIESEKAWFLLFNSENLSMSFRSMSTDVKQDMHRRKKTDNKAYMHAKTYIHTQWIRFI